MFWDFIRGGERVKKTAIASVVFLLIMSFTSFTSCEENCDIHLISRESGSGTREAFIQLTGVKQNGCDNTALNSEVTSSNLVVIKSVADDKNAIGYTSLGTLNGNVKPIAIDGVKPEAANVADGTYPLVRKFDIVFSEPLEKTAADFKNFIMSEKGQRVIEEKGYIPIDNKSTAPLDYKISKHRSEKIAIAGSTSVAPLMEVLAESYMELNPSVRIEIQQSGSSAGITSVAEGICHMGMSSRPLTNEETEKGLSAVTIAADGIVVIVNPKNHIKELSLEDIRGIFTGKITKW